MCERAPEPNALRPCQQNFCLSSVPDLDLPDAPDFISQRTLLSLDQCLFLIEEHRRLFPPTAAEMEARRQRRVTAEFIL